MATKVVLLRPLLGLSMEGSESNANEDVHRPCGIGIVGEPEHRSNVLRPTKSLEATTARRGGAGNGGARGGQVDAVGCR